MNGGNIFVFNAMRGFSD